MSEALGTSPDPTQEEIEAAQQAIEACRACMRAVLAEVAPALDGIRAQLARACGELREHGIGDSLQLAVANLAGFVALLEQLTGAFDATPLPALDRLDRALRRFLTGLERALGATPRPQAIAERIDAELLPALARWPDVEAELAAAIEGFARGLPQAP